MCFLSIFRGRGKPQFSWLCNQQSCINWPLMYNLQASRIKLLISSACSPMFMAVTQLPGSTGAGEPSFSTIFFMLETVSSEFHWFSQCSRWLKASLHIVSYPCHCRDSHRTFLEKALLENGFSFETSFLGKKLNSINWIPKMSSPHPKVLLWHGFHRTV